LDGYQAARFLGVHPRTLQRMVIRGEISGVRVGRLWRFLPSSITRWVEEHDLASSA
jgi:excisionase family DNA binding protein